ncbi:MAG: SH3 domain-containing protein [Thermodesulfobacteriota bacterium]
MGKDTGTNPTPSRAVAALSLPFALATLLLLLVISAPAMADRAPARVEEAVNVRAGRGTSTPRVARLAPGEQVLAGECRDGWSAVSRPDAPGKLLGYVFSPLLKPRAAGLEAANPVPGTEFTLTPSIRVQETHDSNVMFQDVSDLETRASPLLEGRLRTERTSVLLRAAADVLRYSRYNEFDRVNREASLALSHATTETTRLELRGRARSDHTFESALEESGTVAVKNPHHEYALEPAVAYRLNERTEVRLGGEAVANRYPRRAHNDMQTRSGTLALVRALEAGASALLARARYTAAAYDAGTQDTGSLAAGMDWKISETLSWMLSAGPSLSRDRFGADDETHLGLAGESRLRLELERGSVELGGDLGAVPGSGGEDTMRRRLLGNAVLHLTDRLDLTLAGTWYRSRTRGHVRERDNAVVNLTPSLDYALGERSTLRLSYDYTCIDDLEEEVYRQRQRISLSLHLEFPRRLR